MAQKKIVSQPIIEKVQNIELLKYLIGLKTQNTIKVW